MEKGFIRETKYNGEYFQQHEGTEMGNSLSPFIENLFMSKFETEVKINSNISLESGSGMWTISSRKF
ncbi:hypothetical protein NQ318_009183 [Aromia moschata]|uniref:Uncharacterized protein n=1 Tax=Aromia moschata TaxID=1265417 RepID=A0AAV8Y3Q6_9CUCU|nr:hypothetical protein NQ318_009183 [Aromia moschata]